MSRSNFRFVLTLVASVGTAGASAGSYTDRTSFNAAAGNLTIETFESAALVGNSSAGAVQSIAFADFGVSSNPTATKLVDADHFYGSFNTTPAGKNYLSLDTDAGLKGSTATFSFNALTHAIGFDYTGVTERGTTFDLTVDGTTFPLMPNVDNNSVGFWGYTSAAGFTSFTLTTSLDSGYSIDQVTYTAAIPEPQTYAMMLLGLGGIGLLLRRRARSTST
jgi:hypothetical protein